MSEDSIGDALADELDRLGEADRRRVLEYARSLSGGRPRGTSGAALLSHFGVLSEEDAGEIAAAIEEGGTAR